MDLIKKIFNDFHLQLIITIIVLFLIPVCRYVISKIIFKYGAYTHIKEIRARLIIKYFNILLNILVIILLITIWGVNPKNILWAFSSVFAIIGVAFFAQWSLLSNITAGFIIYFTAPFKIGDTIKIIDKDIPIEATVEDIKAFYIYLKTVDQGESIVFPNNLVLQKIISVVTTTE